METLQFEAATETFVQAINTLNSNKEKTALDHFNFYVNVVVDGLLCLFGFFGNICTIIVIKKERKNTSNAVLLQALAIADTAFLVYVVLYVVLRSVYPYTGYLESIHNIESYLVAFVLPFGWTAQTAAIWMIMVVAVDRYLVVAHPFKATVWCTASRAKKAGFGVMVSAILFNAIRWPRYYLMEFGNNVESNSTFVSHLAADIPGWNEELYRNIYHVGLTFICLFTVPLLVISVVNICLINAIHKALEKRATMTKGSHGKEASLNVTIMMVVVISVFVVCQLPDFIASIMGNFEINEVIYSYYAGIKEVLLVFNSSCNFYLYLIFNRNLRRRFVSHFVKSSSYRRDSSGAITTVDSSIKSSHEKLTT